MGKFKFTKTGIKDMFVVEPTVFEDERGYFMETYQENDFRDAGYDLKFVQDNQSKSTKGVLRGLHLQANYPQGKLVRVIRGVVFDVGVDLRGDSKTYGEWYGEILSEDNKKSHTFLWAFHTDFRCCRMRLNSITERMKAASTGH